MSKIVLRYVLSKDFPFIFAFAKLQNFFFRACSYLRQNLQAVNTKALDSNLSSALVNTKIQMCFQKDFDSNMPSLAWPSKGERVESIKFFMW